MQEEHHGKIMTIVAVLVIIVVVILGVTIIVGRVQKNAPPVEQTVTQSPNDKYIAVTTGHGQALLSDPVVQKYNRTTTGTGKDPSAAQRQALIQATSKK